MVDNLDELSLELVEGSLTCESITFTMTYNGEDTLYTGDWYVIEENIAGKWHTIPTNQDMIFTMEAYPITDDKPVNFEVNWSTYYDSLPTGTYRILKKVHEHQHGGNIVNYYLALEFEISN